jgi:hypothetical protein
MYFKCLILCTSWYYLIVLLGKSFFILFIYVFLKHSSEYVLSLEIVYVWSVPLCTSQGYYFSIKCILDAAICILHDMKKLYWVLVLDDDGGHQLPFAF